MCESGKIGYPSPQAARRAAALIRRRRGEKNDARVYRCPFCHEYHLSAIKVARKKKINDG